MKIVLDSNVVIDIIQKQNPTRKNIQMRIKSGDEVIIPEHVIREVIKKIPNGQEAIINWLVKQNPMKLTFLRDTEKIIKKAESFEAKFTYCHWPDSRIIAHCSEYDAVLVTRDQKMRLCADFLGVMTTSPYNLGGFVQAA